LQKACKQCQERRDEWGGATTQRKFDKARKVWKERGWEWGELERVGGKEGSVERGIEVGKVLYV
jgi:hypothetical protein